MRMVHIKFRDSMTHRGWTETSIMQQQFNDDDLMCEVVGFLFTEDDIAVGIVQSAMLPDNALHRVADMIKIPKAVIVEMADLVRSSSMVFDRSQMPKFSDSALRNQDDAKG